MVSFEIDDFISNKDSTIWIATLSDGRAVYQDDDRPEHEEKRSWVRLQEYCKKNNLFVKKMAIKFRSHTEHLPESEEGYFFRKGVLGSPAEKKTIHRYICGPIINGEINVTVFRIPEIIIEETEIRKIEGNEDGIIWKKKRKRKPKS